MNNLNVIVFVGACIVLSIIVACVSGLGFPAAFATTVVFGAGYALGRLLTIQSYGKKFDAAIKSIDEAP